MISYKVTSSGVKLIDSYKVSKRDMEPILFRLRCWNPSWEIWQRSTRSLYLEWACHNAAYALGIRRDKTKDCDLNVSLPWYASALYWVLGGIVWLFIK